MFIFEVLLKVLMFIKKRYFFIGIFFLSSIVTFMNFGFSSVKSTYEVENITCLDYPEDTVPAEPISVDYKSLLGERLLSFTSKIDYKAKRTRLNGVVLIAYKDQILFEKAYGYKNPIQKDELTPEVSFELASLSKQFTAAAVLKLDELNQVNLEESFSTYFPEFKFDNIKVKDLLKHSSGLWDYMYLTEAYWEETCAPNQADIINLINNHQRILNFRPGRRFDYNNTNYALLVALVEKLSEQNFDDFLNQYFFDPYCIEEAYVGVESRKLNNVVNGFHPYRRGYLELPPSFHNGALGDKGIHINAGSLWNWFEALKNKKSLSETSVEKMFNLNSYKYYNYGMGFRTRLSYDGQLEIYHDGLWDGFRNGLHYYPEDDLTVIVLSHTQNKNKSYFQNYLKNQAIQMINELPK